MSVLKLIDINKSFGSVDVLRGINMDVENGDFIVLIGPSGCGKSTLLSIIAGLESASAGEVVIDDKIINDVHPKDRNIAMVFQNYALYPTMSVRKNLTFGLEARRVPKSQHSTAVDRVSKLLQIEALLDRKPSQLSGGQRQRVAMGRALVRDPALFLFDEPLSNLDAKLRSEMRMEIRRLHQNLGITTVYVTHDQVEAMTLATKIAIMDGGLVQQFAEPRQVYEKPANIFVATFMGSQPMNLLPAELVKNGATAGVKMANSDGDCLPVLPETLSIESAPHKIQFGFRAENIWEATDEADNTPNVGYFRGRVLITEPLGSETVVFLDVGGHEIAARVAADASPTIGSEMRFAVDMRKASYFDPASGNRLH